MSQSIPFSMYWTQRINCRPKKRMLIAILHRRLAEEGRHRVIAEVREAGKELEAGDCKVGRR